MLAGVLRARETGEGCEIELGRAMRRRFFIGTASRAILRPRPEEEVTAGNKAD